MHSQLSRQKKGDISASAYYSKMKGFADEMAAAGKKIDDDELIGHILNGLDSDYNPLVSSLAIKDALSLSDLYSQLLSYESRLAQQRSEDGRFFSSTNSASRGRGLSTFAPRDRGRGSNSSSRGSNNNNSSSFGQGSSRQDSDEGPMCQLCERYGHTVHDCWYQFNKKYVAPRDGGARPIKTGPQKSDSSAVPSYGIDTN